MSDTRNIKLTIDGAPVERSVETRRSLVDFLRLDLGLTGSHVGCEHGACGACTVRVDGEAGRGCLMFAVQANGKTIQTVEGLAKNGELNALFNVKINEAPISPQRIVALLGDAALGRTR